MVRSVLFFLALCFCTASLAAQAQPVKRYPLPRKVMPLEKALIKLAEAGAPISYRPDQLPKIAIKVPGGRRQLSGWLLFLLRDTELIFRPGPAGFLILPDPDLFERTVTIHGIITDAVSGERLIGAAGYNTQLEKGELSNEYGFYSLDIKGGRRELRISYTGYEAYETELVLRSDTTFDVALERAGDLPQIEVIASAGEQEELYLTQSEISISQNAVDLVNGPGGEKDIVNVARLLPGITSGANGVGGLIFRGSSSGHNLVMLDGVPGTSLLAANLTAEGPISNGKSSYLLSGRFFWGSPLLRAFSRSEKQKKGRDGTIDYTVHDLNFKLNQQVGDKGRLYLSVYHGVDGYSNTSKQQDSARVLTQSGTVFDYRAEQKRQEDIDWSNTVGALRYNHEFSDRFFGNFRLSYSDLLVRANFERSDSLYEAIREDLTHAVSSGRFGTDIKQLGAAFDGQLELGGDAQLRFGTSLDFNRFLPQLRSGRVPLSAHPKLSSLEESQILRATQFAAYASLKGRLGGLHYRLGLRGQLWDSNGRFFNLSPRLLLAGKLSPRTRWRATYDRLAQPIHLVSSTVIRLATDFWVPATDGLPPSISEQLAFQLDRDLGPDWLFTVAGYHRDLRHLVQYSGGGANADWLDKLSTGKGFANGLEFTLHRSGKKLTGWLNYTLAQSPYALNRRVDFSASWRYETGGAYSFSRESIILANPTIDHNPIFYDIRSTYLNRNSTLVKNRQFVQIFFGGILPTLSYKASFSGGR